MIQSLNCLRQGRLIGRYGLLILYLTKNPIPSNVGTVKMGYCRHLAEAIRDVTKKCRDVALRMGICFSKCWGNRCACSSCLPSAETVGYCVGRVLLVFAVVVCCPCVCCWCICRAILFFRRRGGEGDGRIIEDSGTRNGIGYNTFDDQGNEPDDLREIVSRRPIQNSNYLFYTNQLKSQPRGDYIDAILTKWHGNYDLLESHHGFIQWLFPLYESGVNSQAQVLNDKERQEIMLNEEAYRRIVAAYKLMLDFYGIVLVDEETGDVVRSENYQERFRNLNRNGHNFLRISRIIKCLRIFNYEHLAKSLVKFFITEIFRERNLPRCRDSCNNFWILALSPEDADEMYAYMGALLAEDREKSTANAEDVHGEEEMYYF